MENVLAQRHLLYTIHAIGATPDFWHWHIQRIRGIALTFAYAMKYNRLLQKKYDNKRAVGELSAQQIHSFGKIYSKDSEGNLVRQGQATNVWAFEWVDHLWTTWKCGKLRFAPNLMKTCASSKEHTNNVVYCLIKAQVKYPCENSLKLKIHWFDGNRRCGSAVFSLTFSDVSESIHVRILCINLLSHRFSRQSFTNNQTKCKNVNEKRIARNNHRNKTQTSKRF